MTRTPCAGRLAALALSAALQAAAGAPASAPAAPAASGGPAVAAVGARGDPDRGRVVYERCIGCHALERDRTGPRHCGLFGRRAGSLAGYAYSSAMKRSRLVWTDATLDRFLRDPAAAIPGTAMGYAGVADAAERADLIAYLRRANASPACGLH